MLTLKSRRNSLFYTSLFTNTEKIREGTLMKKNLIIKHICLVALSLCLIMTMTTWAADVKIEWTDPEKYRDIRGGDENQNRFQERVIKALTEHFENAAAETLPAEQTLDLKITDVDLAGDVDYFFFRFSRSVRVMRDVHFPSIEFNYVLKDENGNILKSGEENIKDMGYLFSGKFHLNDPPFDYEKRMIDDWFRKNFQ